MHGQSCVHGVGIATLLMATNAAIAQDVPGGDSACQYPLLNFQYELPKFESSRNGEFIVRIEQPRNELGDPVGNRRAAVFRQEGADQYALQREVPLPKAFPASVLLSDSGILVLVGEQWGHPVDDTVYVYGSDGQLWHEVTGDEVLTQDEMAISEALWEGEPYCGSANPWICWSEEIGIRIDNLELMDNLGNWVTLNLLTGNITREALEPRYSFFEDQ